MILKSKNQLVLWEESESRPMIKMEERYDLSEVFSAYARFGGMPGIADVGLDQEKALILLDGIYSTVIVRDILERENRRGQKRIADPVLLRKIVMFLADNIGSNISVSFDWQRPCKRGTVRGRKPEKRTQRPYRQCMLMLY